MQVIIFAIQGKRYGISSDDVIEISEPVEWNEIPQSPEWLIGLINLRGSVLSLINFEKFLNDSKETEELCYNSTIIVKHDKGKVAFATGTVTQVVEVNEATIQWKDHHEENAVKGYFSEGDFLVNMINLQTLFLKNEG